MEHEIIKHETSHPPSASRQPDNAYYLRGCAEVHRSPSYASCLFKIEENEAGRSNALHQECIPAIRSGRCQAVSMRQKEQLEGVALYYFPRRPPQALHLPAAVAGDFGVRITNLTDPALIPTIKKTVSNRFTDVVNKVASVVAPKKPASVLDTIDSGSYADAINTPAPAAKKPITKDDLARLAAPGESLIDTAKRLLNEAKETA